MLVEIGDALIGVETHRLFEVGHRFIHCRVRDKGQAPLRGLTAVPKLTCMIIKSMVLLAAALAMPTAASAQPIPPQVQARIDRILKAAPLIDGHNDLPGQLRENYGLSVEGLAAAPTSARTR